MSSTRRRFLGAATLGTGLGAELIAENPQPPQKVASTDRIRVALIGNGIRGIEDGRSSVAAGAEMVAVSDIYEGRLTRAREVWGNQIFTTRDYREVLARTDVDAVIVATPDHWHRQICIDAMNARKDVYCEKPLVQLISEGKDVIEAQNKTGRILQAGSQNPSSIVFQKAKELMARGAVGELNMVEAWIDRNSALGAWQYPIPPDASPETIDWDRFLGRAPKVPFEPDRLFRWRKYRDYGTGVGGDLFVHLFTGMHYILDAIGPTRVYTTGGIRFWKDGRDVPDIQLGLYDYPARGKYPAFNLALRVNFANGAGENTTFRFVGTEGVLTVGNGVTVTKTPRETEPGIMVDSFSKAMADSYVKQYREKYPVRPANSDSMRPAEEQRYAPPRGYDSTLEHHRNFLNAVRTRKTPLEDAVFGFRAAGPALLSNISYFDQRVCVWDPETMTMKG